LYNFPFHSYKLKIEKIVKIINNKNETESNPIHDENNPEIIFFKGLIKLIFLNALNKLKMLIIFFPYLGIESINYKIKMNNKIKSKIFHPFFK